MSMNTQKSTDATITAEPGSHQITITRDFAATPDKVWRAFTEPELMEKWIGPNRLTTTVETNEVRDGGRWRMVHTDTDGTEFGFHGIYHGEQSADLSMRTFEWEGLPGHVSLEWTRIEDLGNGRSRVHGSTVFMSVEDRDGMIASGMDVGVNEGYERLDEVLAAGR
ncbi:MAG: SRPBCC domain-containing protein [Actinomycetota bacterium]|nr:SRPBCC domain-containing protein [Actinomycetota bacterium]